MLPLLGGESAAPAHAELHCGAGGVDHALVSEREHAVTRRGGAGGEAEGLRQAGGGPGVHLTVSPAVGDHRPVRPGGRGTPRHGGVGVAALGVLHPAVQEGEHAGRPGVGGAGVGHPLAEAAQPDSVIVSGGSSEAASQQDWDEWQAGDGLHLCLDMDWTP